MDHTALKRHLVLSDGTAYTGIAFGADVETAGEVVFNTGMTGYQEILTDPSYAGQIVLLTYPLIGNYGINDDDDESIGIQVSGLIVRELCETPSNWRSRRTLHEFLLSNGIPGLRNVDTRAITKRLRTGGVKMGMLTDGSIEDALLRLRSLPTYDDQDFVSRVSTQAPYAWGYEGKEPIDMVSGEYKCKIVVLDLGLKYNILRRLAALHCRSIVLPHASTAEEVLGWSPDGVVISPGPGDPSRLDIPMSTVKGLLGKVPMLGICLGNQMIARALGGKTFKLPFGHRGSNHPVKDLRTGKVTITSQNHGYAVDADSLRGSGAEVWQINLNDQTVEGIRHDPLGAMSIQYHPEAAPGPWDSRPYFDALLERIGRAGS